MRVEEFRYELPDAAIAQHPVEPRDSARLLDTRDGTDHRFADLAARLEPGDLVVVNTTRVRHARLVGSRSETGGRIELLLLTRRPTGGWSALAAPARRLRPGVSLEFGPLTATVTDGPVDGIVGVEFDDERLIDSVGMVPLPPYITEELADPGRYQTIFADHPGSAAAPTAGLHFTQRVLDRLATRGIELATVELDVGIGTFRPITA
ncbi:MAG: S-adenosylmethionine:tRNA ribosyltransferase-isomerase, partial [Acidimicrobiia bacterium]